MKYKTKYLNLIASGSGKKGFFINRKKEKPIKRTYLPNEENMRSKIVRNPHIKDVGFIKSQISKLIPENVDIYSIGGHGSITDDYMYIVPKNIIYITTKYSAGHYSYMNRNLADVLLKYQLSLMKYVNVNDYNVRISTVDFNKFILKYLGVQHSLLNDLIGYVLFPGELMFGFSYLMYPFSIDISRIHKFKNQQISNFVYELKNMTAKIPLEKMFSSFIIQFTYLTKFPLSNEYMSSIISGTYHNEDIIKYVDSKCMLNTFSKVFQSYNNLWGGIFVYPYIINDEYPYNMCNKILCCQKQFFDKLKNTYKFLFLSEDSIRLMMPLFSLQLRINNIMNEKTNNPYIETFLSSKGKAVMYDEVICDVLGEPSELRRDDVDGEHSEEERDVGEPSELRRDDVGEPSELRRDDVVGERSEEERDDEERDDVKERYEERNDEDRDVVKERYEERNDEDRDVVKERYEEHDDEERGVVKERYEDYVNDDRFCDHTNTIINYELFSHLDTTTSTLLQYILSIDKLRTHIIFASHCSTNQTDERINFEEYTNINFENIYKHYIEFIKVIRKNINVDNIINNLENVKNYINELPYDTKRKDGLRPMIKYLNCKIISCDSVRKDISIECSEVRLTTNIQYILQLICLIPSNEPFSIDYITLLFDCACLYFILLGKILFDELNSNININYQYHKYKFRLLDMNDEFFNVNFDENVRKISFETLKLLSKSMWMIYIMINYFTTGRITKLNKMIFSHKERRAVIESLEKIHLLFRIPNAFKNVDNLDFVRNIFIANDDNNPENRFSMYKRFMNLFLNLYI
jgi:hypothetical protein